jgi:hypothetical protein
MKKILRLVTTSVLTLTLVACGEASSSVASSTPATSGSVSSPVSTFAAVSSITLSAASDGLEQVLGAQKRVVVTATLNPNTNPTQLIEWYINGVRSQQNGKVFEFTPDSGGKFEISAKVQNTTSNVLTVNVGVPELVMESYVFDGSKSLEIKAPSGVNIDIIGKTIEEGSYYNFKDGVYFIELKEAFKQGETATIRLSKDGFETLVDEIVFDERVFAIDTLKAGLIGSLTAVTAVDGVYKVTKPFEEGTAFDRRYEIALKSEKIFDTAPVSLTVETIAPVGAIVPVVTTTLVNSLTAMQFDITSKTVAGLYTHKITLDGRLIEVKVEVEK